MRRLRCIFAFSLGSLVFMFLGWDIPAISRNLSFRSRADCLASRGWTLYAGAHCLIAWPDASLSALYPGWLRRPEARRRRAQRENANTAGDRQGKLFPESTTLRKADRGMTKRLLLSNCKIVGMKRYLDDLVAADLQRKIALLIGPRQIGKMPLCRQSMAGFRQAQRGPDRKQA